MSPSSLLCRLCLNSCIDFKSLYDDSAQGNELYEMTRAYFHPKIVDMDRAKRLTVICSECVQHMRDFHSFQALVIMAQMKLKKISTVTEEIANSESTSIAIFQIDPLDIKVEEEFIDMIPEETFEAGALVQVEENTHTGELVHGPTFALVHNEANEEELADVHPTKYHSSGNDEYIPTSKDTNRSTSPLASIVADEYVINDEHEDRKMHVQLPELDIMDVNPESSELSSDDDVPLAQCVDRPPSNCEVSQVANGFDYGKNTKSDIVDDLLAKWMPMIKCVACPESYPRLSLLQNHFRQTHPGKEFYIVCCCRKFRKRFRIKQHLMLHSDPDAFKCYLCDKSYDSTGCLVAHKKEHHPANYKFPCDLCDRGFDVQRGLTLHYTRVHDPFKRSSAVLQADGQTVYLCPDCGKHFDSKVSLQRHSSSMHARNSRHECTVCSKDYKTALRLREHIASHQGKHLYECLYCPQRVRSISSMSRHRIRKHPHETNKLFYKNIGQTRPDSQGPSARVNLKAHVSQVADGHASLSCLPSNKHETLDGPTAKGVPIMKCVACPEYFPSLSLLEDHFAKQHPSEEFYISCCSRKFRRRFAIREHLKLHDDLDAFKCDLCDKSYETRRALRLHVTHIHPQNLKFPCELCGKCFEVERGLKVHCSRYHNTDPPRKRKVKRVTKKAESPAEIGEHENGD